MMEMKLGRYTQDLKAHRGLTRGDTPDERRRMTHEEMKAIIDARREAAEALIVEWTEMFGRFGVEDFTIMESPFGEYVTVDIDPDEGLKMAEQINAIMDGM
jgi:hypothetical protein